MKLSKDTKEVCRTYYNDNCGGCPLRPICVQPIRRSRDDHNEWVKELNQLAKEVVQ